MLIKPLLLVSTKNNEAPAKRQNVGIKFVLACHAH